MASSLNAQDLACLLQGGAELVRDRHELLSRLDAAIGDGDHGTTMKKVAEAMLEAVRQPHVPALSGLLEANGWNVLSVDGGSSSSLLGSFFSGMAEPALGLDALDSPALAAVFEAGLAKLRAQTPAQLGDKTMLDALIPAVAALRQAADEHLLPVEAMARAAAAAACGAEDTKNRQAKFGRARNLGSRSLGSADPGATSISLLFAGFHAGLANRQ
jgi:dihydroxyacetone kinase-like protein